MSKTLHILKHELIFFFFCRRNFDVISCRCRSQRMPLALQCVLHWVERSELRLRWAVCELFFFFLLFGGIFFEVGKKKMCRSPPPLNLLLFFFWPLCLFLDGLGAFLLSQSALRSLKCPFYAPADKVWRGHYALHLSFRPSVRPSPELVSTQ